MRAVQGRHPGRQARHAEPLHRLAVPDLDLRGANGECGACRPCGRLSRGARRQAGRSTSPRGRRMTAAAIERRIATVTRAEAKARGLKRYFTGNPCKHGHIAERYTVFGKCVVCACERWRLDSKRDPDKHKRYRRKNGNSGGGWRRYDARMLAKNPDYHREKERKRLAKMRAAVRALREIGIEI